jgi:hypothetical protein
MNGQSLPILHETSFRLYVETQFGFTMVTCIRAVELIAAI